MAVLTLTRKELKALIFAAELDLETVQKSLATGDTSFVGQGSALVTALRKLQKALGPK